MADESSTDGPAVHPLARELAEVGAGRLIPLTAL